MKKVSEYYEQLTEWFYRHGVREIIPYSAIGQEIKRLRKKGNVTQAEVGHAVSMCRIDMELTKGTTIVNVRGRGYKVATPKELAIYSAKCGKRTIHWADRTWRALEITDRKLLPSAVRQVFPESKIRTLSQAGKKFVKSFVDYTNVQRRITNGKKK